MPTPLILDGVGVDALFLANAADVPPNGLVYVHGGGWSRCWPPPNIEYPYERIIPIVAIFRVPWTETNVEHPFKIAIEDADSRVLASATGAFKAGRQPDLTDGASQVVVISLPSSVKLDRRGIYSVSAEIGGVEKKRIQFEAIDDPARPHGRS